MLVVMLVYKMPDFGLDDMKESLYTRTIYTRNPIFTEEICGVQKMKKKMKQVTDNIHGTIYLSELESEMIATPYFYRLHDIYQSSTAYMTFPSNRTKRYEHSLGTMELASSMLFSAVSNANQDTRDELFKKLRFYFGEIFRLAVCYTGSQVAEYFTKCRSEINNVFMQICCCSSPPQYAFRCCSHFSAAYGICLP